jgi:RNA-directed DNA polymerase
MMTGASDLLNVMAIIRRAARSSAALAIERLRFRRGHRAVARFAASMLIVETVARTPWQTYGENLEEKLKDLHDKVHRGSYRAPARRASTSARATRSRQDDQGDRGPRAR